MSSIGTPVVNAPNLYVNGMLPVWVSNTTFTVGTGYCRDSTNVNDINIGLPLNVAQTGTGEQPVAAGTGPVTVNSALTGAGGLDTGTIAASTVYAIYAVGDSMNAGNSTAMISLSLTSPVIPYGYDMFRLIGYIVTDASSHFLLGYWVDHDSTTRVFFYDAPIATAVTAGASTTYAHVDLTSFVPLVNNLRVSLYTNYLPSAAGQVLNLQPGNATGDAVTIIGQVSSVHLASLNTVLAQTVAISTVPSPVVNYKLTSGGAVAINVAGFQFNL